MYYFLSSPQDFDSVDELLTKYFNNREGINVETILSSDELLAEKGTTNKTNQQRLLESINQVKSNNNEDAVELSDVMSSSPVPKHTRFVVPGKTIFQRIELSNRSDIPFYRTNVGALYDSYYRAFALAEVDTPVHYQQAGITVLLYSIALDRWINLSSIVLDSDVSHQEQLSGFTIDLSPTISDVLPAEILQQENQDVLSPIGNTNVSQTSLQDESGIARYIQKNDLIFISHYFMPIGDRHEEIIEALRNAEERNYTFDLIGLVDVVVESRDPTVAVFSTKIQGRDLMKPFIEDGSYFFAVERIAGRDNAEYPNVVGDNESRVCDQALTRRNLRFVNRIPRNGRLEAVGFGTLDNFEGIPFAGGRSIPQWITAARFFLSYAGFVPDRILDEIGVEQRQVRSTSGEDVTRDIGVWRLVNNVFSSDMDNRFITFSDLSVYQGSIINALRSKAHPPFIEIFGDTYGNRWNFVTRKPPFEKESVREALGGFIDLEQGFRRAKTIHSSRVYNFSAQIISDDQIYTWFRLTPKGARFGAQFKATRILPVFIVPEYVCRWGAHPLDITTNFIETSIGAGNLEDLSYAIRFALVCSQDIKYLIDAFSYLPFTREGVITMMYDPSIKMKNWIYFQPTQEVFYIDGIHRSFKGGTDSENNMTLRVSRGMKAQYIFGDNSYFDILKTPVPSLAGIKRLINNPPNQTEGETGGSTVQRIMENWKIDIKLFNFFLSQRNA